MDSSLESIDHLQARLRRLEYVLQGQYAEDTSEHAASTSAVNRLRELERALDRTVAKSRVSQDLLRLYSQHPDLFDGSTVEEPNESTNNTITNLPIVLAAASSYPLTASRLTSVMDVPIPPASTSANLIGTQGDVARLELLQQNQAKEIAELKQRTAAVLQRWYAVDIIQTGEYWAQMEGRLGRVEQRVRKAELMKEQDEGVV